MDEQTELEVTPWPEIGDDIPLRDQVAEAAFSQWETQEGSAGIWRPELVDDQTRQRWLAIADDVIACIEFDHMIVERT